MVFIYKTNYFDKLVFVTGCLLLPSGKSSEGAVAEQAATVHNKITPPNTNNINLLNIHCIQKKAALYICPPYLFTIEP
jgi:hypothetical protein